MEGGISGDFIEALNLGVDSVALREQGITI